MAEIAREILHVNLEDEMRQSYLDYAMSVIVGRALPDVRDGLKPVHRRILFAMHESNNVYVAPVREMRARRRRRARQIPPARRYRDLRRAGAHGAADFSMRYLLVDGQGNFGSVDGDPPAAYRYTESPHDGARLRAAGRHRQGNGRFRRQLRRQGTGAGRPADARAESAHQRLVGHCRRHGDEHSAAQPGRGRQRMHRTDRRSEPHDCRR